MKKNFAQREKDIEIYKKDLKKYGPFGADVIFLTAVISTIITVNKEFPKSREKELREKFSNMKVDTAFEVLEIWEHYPGLSVREAYRKWVRNTSNADYVM